MQDCPVCCQKLQALFLVPLAKMMPEIVVNLDWGGVCGDPLPPCAPGPLGTAL